MAKTVEIKNCIIQLNDNPDQLKNTVSELTLELAKKKNREEELLVQHNSIQQQVKQLENVNQSLTNIIKQQERSIIILQQEKQNETSKLSQVEKEMEKLKQEQLSIKQNTLPIEQFQQEQALVFQLQEEIKTVKLQESFYKQELLKKQAEIDTLKSKVGEVNLKNNVLAVDIDDLICKSLIGSGQFGCVYKCTWQGKGGGIQVAVKEFAVEDEIEVAVMIKEVEIMRTLHHPNIVQVFGYSLVELQMCIVMELASKGSLYDYLKKNKNIDWPTKWKFAQQAAMALNYLHCNNILHRDVKSLNYLLNEHMELKLCDFGMSKIQSMSSKHITGTKASVLGSHRWRAPEAFDEESIWTKECDIYSLGVTFWEIASQEVPFKLLDDIKVSFQVCFKNARPQMPEVIDAQFKTLIESCWCQDPKQRFTIQQVLAFLTNMQV